MRMRERRIMRYIPARRRFRIHGHAKRARFRVAGIAQAVRLVSVEDDRVARRQQLTAVVHADFECATLTTRFTVVPGARRVPGSVCSGAMRNS